MLLLLLLNFAGRFCCVVAVLVGCFFVLLCATELVCHEEACNGLHGTGTLMWCCILANSGSIGVLVSGLFAIICPVDSRMVLICPVDSWMVLLLSSNRSLCCGGRCCNSHGCSIGHCSCTHPHGVVHSFSLPPQCG